MSRRQSTPNRPLTKLELAVQEQTSPRSDLAVPVYPDRLDRLLGLLGPMRAYITESDADGRDVYASPEIKLILGFTPEEFLETDCAEIHPDDLAGLLDLTRVMRETGQPGSRELRVRHKAGHWVWLETSVVAWYPTVNGELHLMSFTRDISDLKRATAELAESEERYRAVSEMSRDLVGEVDAEGHSKYLGPGFEEVLGYTEEDLLTLEPYSLVHPDDREQSRALMTAAIDNTTPTPVEFRLQHRDGRWLWFEALVRSYPRADGEKRVLSVCRDVTDRKQAEQTRREIEDGMQQAQRLESLGVLAGGIAHDFNNLLTPILGSAGLALTELAQDSPVRARLLRIQKAAQRAADLTNQMLSYAGTSPLLIERLDLTQVIEDISEFVHLALSGTAGLEMQLADDLPAVEADATQIGQIVMNLVSNAAESLPDGGGRVVVTTGVCDVDGALSNAIFAHEITTGRHVFFEVEDNGCGMDEDTRSRIFDPFFTTKFTGRGLGLAAVVGIVRGHRGVIEVDSQVGRGSRFRVLFPAAPGVVDRTSPAAEQIDDWRTDGTVLIIDDDDGVRDLTEDVLRRAGMHVLSASDGAKGVQLFQEHAEKIRLVLLDRTMPALGGAETFEAIRDLSPNAKILLISGYSEERATAKLAGRGLSGFLKKPFLPETLLARVREVLEGLPAS